MKSLLERARNNDSLLANTVACLYRKSFIVTVPVIVGVETAFSTHKSLFSQIQRDQFWASMTHGLTDGVRIYAGHTRFATSSIVCCSIFLLSFLLFFAIRLQKCPPCCVCCSMFSQCRSRKIWDRSIPSVQHLLTKLESCRLLWTEHIPINGLRLQFTTTSNRLATAHSRFAKSPLRSNTAFLS